MSSIWSNISRIYATYRKIYQYISIVVCALILYCYTAITHADDSLLNSISTQLMVEPHQQGRFEQRKYISVLPVPLLSTGQFQLKPENTLEWRIIQPLKSKLIFNDKGIEQDQNGQLIWQASNEQPGIAAIGRILKAVLNTDWPVLKTYFLIKGHRNEQHWSLLLTPIDAQLSHTLTQITLEGENRLYKMHITEANGDRTELDFYPLEP